MSSSNCVTFLYAAGPWERICGFPPLSLASCVFSCFVPAVGLIPRIPYDDDFIQEELVPLQRFLQLWEVAVKLLLSDTERLTEACGIVTHLAVVRLWREMWGPKS